MDREATDSICLKTPAITQSWRVCVYVCVHQEELLHLHFPPFSNSILCSSPLWHVHLNLVSLLNNCKNVLICFLFRPVATYMLTTHHLCMPLIAFYRLLCARTAYSVPQKLLKGFLCTLAPTAVASAAACWRLNKLLLPLSFTGPV